MSILIAPAMQMPSSARATVGDVQQSFAGGLNTVSNDFALLPTQMRKAENVRLTDLGAATRRGGTRQTSAAALAAAGVKQGYSWQQAPGVIYTLAMCNGHLWTTVYGTFPMTWTDRSGGFSTSATPSFAGFRETAANAVYIATGGALQKWDGTTLTSLAPPVHATGICVYHDRLWGWGVAGSLDSIYYSNLSGAVGSIGGDSLGVGASSGGQIIVRTFGQQDIVACRVVNGSLIIWHRQGISRLTGFGQSDITAVPDALTADVGLVGPDAVDVVDNVAYFVSPRGVYEGNEQSVTPVETAETPSVVLPAMLTMSAANLALIKCKINRAKRELWVQLPGIGIYVFNLTLRAWSGPFTYGYTTPDTTCLFDAVDANNQPILLRGDATGFVSLTDPSGIYLDNVPSSGVGGTLIPTTIQCHRMYCGNPTQANAFEWASVLGQFYSTDYIAANPIFSWATLSASGYYQTPLSLTGSFSWDGAGTAWDLVGTVWDAGAQAPLYVPLSGTGPYIDFVMRDFSPGPTSFASVQITAKAYGRR